MKILIDIGHPAHVHYFKNMIKIMKGQGHHFCIVSRDKEVTHRLLQSYNIPYISRGKGAKGLIGKFFYLFKADYDILKIAKKFNPDLFLSFSSPYAAQASFILRKPHIAFTDTEHATLGNLAFSLFTKIIITPKCYEKEFGNKHIKFNGYMELNYLHPKYFTPNNSIFDYLKIDKKQQYILIRFVSWDASHDVGKTGIDYESKIQLVQKLSKDYKVFISSEGALPKELEKYIIKINPEKMHDVLYYSSLFIGEGATMASECAMLGTPAIYVNSLATGYCNELESKYKLLYNFKNMNGVIDKAFELLDLKNKELFINRSQKMINDKIDVTEFIVWFLNNYPDSFNIMKNKSNDE